MEDFIQMLTFLSIGFGLTLSTKLFLSKRGKTVALWLGLYVLLLVGALTEVFFPDRNDLLLIVGTTYWLFGPCLYIYCRYRVGFTINTLRIGLHLIPFVIYVALVSLDLSAPSAEQEWVDFILYELVFMHIFTYFVASLKFIKKQKTVKRDLYKKMQTSSIVAIVTLSICIFGVAWISTHVIVFTGLTVTAGYRLFVQGLLTFLIFAIALLNTETLTRDPIIESSAAK